MKMRFIPIGMVAAGLMLASCADQQQQVTGPRGDDTQAAQGQVSDQATAAAIVDRLLTPKVIPDGVVIPAGALEAREQGLREVAARILAGEMPTAPSPKVAATPNCWVSDFGTAQGMFDDDSRYVGLGFDFKFYGNTYSTIYVNSNGNMTFNGAYYDWSNPNVPNGGLVLIAPLFGDFTPSGGWGPSDVYTNTIGTAPNRQFVATWYIVPEFSGSAGPNTFQAVLMEGSNDILFAYNGLSTDGFNWAGDPTMDVGISSGAGQYINYASGGAIPALDGTNVGFHWNGSDYVASSGCISEPVDTTPPAISLNGPAELTLECHVDSYTEQGASATDDVDGPLAVSTSGSVDTEAEGDYTITYTATDGSGNSASATRTVHVVDTTPPAIALNGSAYLTLECHVDPYVEAGATASDLCDGPVAVGVSGSVDTESVGDYTVAYTASDDNGNTTTTTRTVHVVDTTAPALTLTLSATSLWPPNHLMVPVGVISASDLCDALVALSIAVTSNEPENGTGDGDTAPDWQIVDNGDGTASVAVRAERKGNGTGRIYTIAVTATDDSGNSTAQSGIVTVPHSKKK